MHVPFFIIVSIKSFPFAASIDSIALTIIFKKSNFDAILIHFYRWNIFCIFFFDSDFIQFRPVCSKL